MKEAAVKVEKRLNSMNDRLRAVEQRLEKKRLESLSWTVLLYIYGNSRQDLAGNGSS